MDGVEIGRVTFNFVALAISICYRVLDLRLYRKADDGGVASSNGRLRAPLNFLCTASK